MINSVTFDAGTSSSFGGVKALVGTHLQTELYLYIKFHGTLAGVSRGSV